MRVDAAHVFHTITVFYLLTMDLLYALKLLEVLSVRTDLLWAHYRGLGLQFFTVWSQVTFMPVNHSSSSASHIFLERQCSFSVGKD
jgi:hypothetical protein